MLERFKKSRADGRSNTQVLLDLLRSGSAGQIYTYAELSATLSEGLDRTYSKKRVCGICSGAFVSLLSELNRALTNVPRVGFKLSHANDHTGIALNKKRRATVQMRKSVATLNNVRHAELSPEARVIHEGTSLLVNAQYHQMASTSRRELKTLDAIKRITG